MNTHTHTDETCALIKPMKRETRRINWVISSRYMRDSFDLEIERADKKAL